MEKNSWLLPQSAIITKNVLSEMNYILLLTKALEITRHLLHEKINLFHYKLP